MTEREQAAEWFGKIAAVAAGMSKATHILGLSRDEFIKRMDRTSKMLKDQAVSTVPFQSECPECKRKITVAFVNGQRRVKWSE